VYNFFSNLANFCVKNTKSSVQNLFSKKICRKFHTKKFSLGDGMVERVSTLAHKRTFLKKKFFAQQIRLFFVHLNNLKS
jgi:hypothetical protein